MRFKINGTVVCWSWVYDIGASPPEGELTFVRSRYHHTCGVRTDRKFAVQYTIDT